MPEKNTNHKVRHSMLPGLFFFLAWSCALKAQMPAVPQLGCGRTLASIQAWVFPDNKPLFFSLPEQTVFLIPEPLATTNPPARPPFHWKVAEQPFFCRLEYRLDKKTQLPVKFRLGSVEYVDWLEGKPGATYFNH